MSTLARRIIVLALLPACALAAGQAQAQQDQDQEQRATVAAAVQEASSPDSQLPPVTAASIDAARADTEAGEKAEATRKTITSALSAGTVVSHGESAQADRAMEPGLRVEFHNGSRAHTEETALALRIVLGLTLLTLVPAILVSLTGFLRIIIVLSMLRHALGTQETPPNTVVIGLALFLTLFTMSPVIQKVNHDAFQPFMDGKVGMEAAYEKGIVPVRAFMVRQTREQDLALMVELSKAQRPATIDDVSNVQLIPAFMLSELRTAFQIGFVIFLPFLLIDLIVASILMGLGMMMVPPASISLPLKILMFVLVDGWSLVLKALMGSFH